MKRMWLLVGSLMFIVALYEITMSYAKYTATASGNAIANAGSWAISINNSDIVNGNATPKTFTVSNVTYLTNPYIEPGMMGPSSVGYFDFLIDPSGSSTAVRFDISIDSTDFGINDSIQIQSACKVVNGVEDPTAITRTAANVYTGVIPLSEVNNNQATTARVYIVWLDNGDNDEGDTEVGDERDVQLDLPINVVVSQYSGETITAYQENNGGE